MLYNKGMKYRCPYCRKEFAEKPRGICPACGKAMRVPEDKAARRERERRLRQAHREFEARKAELKGGLGAVKWRNPKVYLGIIVVFVILATALFKSADVARNRKAAEPPVLRAGRHVDVLAVALGRYRFHTGAFPTAAQGLAALVRHPKDVPGWDGPYVNQLRKDPWGTPYGYAPPDKPGALPRVWSCGPDGAAGTEDDVTPGAELFEPGTDWTNGWVHEEQRVPGVRIIH
jgi:general secretion pathway protein G